MQLDTGARLGPYEIIGLLGATLRGASPTALADAHEAWDRGDYPAALNAYLEIISGPHGDSALAEIALQTGELYRTRELTSDGGLAPGSIVAVKAVNARGLEGWDWARARVR